MKLISRSLCLAIHIMVTSLWASWEFQASATDWEKAINITSIGMLNKNDNVYIKIDDQNIAPGKIIKRSNESLTLITPSTIKEQTIIHLKHAPSDDEIAAKKEAGEHISFEYEKYKEDLKQDTQYKKIIILINDGDQNKIDSLANQLHAALQQKAAPIITAKNLIYNILTLLNDEELKPTDWEIYQHNFFYLLIPKNYISQTDIKADRKEAKELKLSEKELLLGLNLSKAGITQVNNISNQQDWINLIGQEFPAGPFFRVALWNKKDLGSKILFNRDIRPFFIPEGTLQKTKENEQQGYLSRTEKIKKKYGLPYKRQSWIAYLSGHGTNPRFTKYDIQETSIAGLSPSEFIKFLSFFSYKVDTTAFYYTTCYGGGENSEFVKEMILKIKNTSERFIQFLNPKMIIGIGALTNQPSATTSFQNREERYAVNYQKFFESMQQYLVGKLTHSKNNDPLKTVLGYLDPDPLSTPWVWIPNVGYNKLIPTFKSITPGMGELSDQAKENLIVKVTDSIIKAKELENLPPFNTKVSQTPDTKTIPIGANLGILYPSKIQATLSIATDEDHPIPRQGFLLSVNKEELHIIDELFITKTLSNKLEEIFYTGRFTTPKLSGTTLNQHVFFFFKTFKYNKLIIFQELTNFFLLHTKEKLLSGFFNKITGTFYISSDSYTLLAKESIAHPQKIEILNQIFFEASKTDYLNALSQSLDHHSRGVATSSLHKHYEEIRELAQKPDSKDKEFSIIHTMTQSLKEKTQSSNIEEKLEGLSGLETIVQQGYGYPEAFDAASAIFQSQETQDKDIYYNAKNILIALIKQNQQIKLISELAIKNLSSQNQEVFSNTNVIISVLVKNNHEILNIVNALQTVLTSKNLPPFIIQTDLLNTQLISTFEMVLKKANFDIIDAFLEFITNNITRQLSYPEQARILALAIGLINHSNNNEKYKETVKNLIDHKIRSQDSRIQASLNKIQTILQKTP